MAELLTTYKEVNSHLPTDRLVADDDNAAQIQIGVARVVRGYLSGVFTPATIAAWVSPVTTPELIREVAGKLIAAQLYQSRYSSDDTDYSAYARKLYDDVFKKDEGTLWQIRNRIIFLPEVTDDEEATLTTVDFYPNSADDQPPKFTMSSVF